VNLHTVFVREDCIFPERIDLRKEPFCNGWLAMIGIIASDLDKKIRSARWHFMSMTDSHSSRGLGRTREIAIHRALVSALKEVKGCFNTAELVSIQFTNCLGLKMARVTLHVRQIQRHASLAMAAESRLQEVLAL
jgi:hypothetical protein